jgi:hypothetical protein
MEIQDLDNELVDIDVIEDNPRNLATLEDWRKASSTVRGYLSYKEGLGEKFDKGMEKIESFFHDIDYYPVRSALDTDPNYREEEKEPPEVREWLDGEVSAEPVPLFTQDSLLFALTGTVPDTVVEGSEELDSEDEEL